MSSIDERIVQMQFNNSQFEKGIKESLKSLESPPAREAWIEIPTCPARCPPDSVASREGGADWNHVMPVSVQSVLHASCSSALV